jgi:bacteriocin-like protein
MNQNKKKNNESMLSKFKHVELTKKELRTIQGGYAGDVIDPVYKNGDTRK